MSCREEFLGLCGKKLSNVLGLHVPVSPKILLLKGPVQSKSMFISIDQLPKIIEFHTIIVHNYSSVDFILIFFDTSAAILKNLKLY